MTTLRRSALAAGTLSSLLAAPLLQAAEFDCVIEPRQVVEIRSPVEGLINRLNVNRGDTVRKGQVIAEIDTSVERAAAAIARQRSEMEGAVRSGESRVEFTSRKMSRAEQLARDKYVSAEAGDQAASEHRVAQADLLDAQDNRKVAALEYTRQMELIRLKTIRSPIDGVVVERIMNVGELAESGVGRKALFRLAELGLLHVEVLLPASAYGLVKPGMQVEVRPEIPVGSVHGATVRVVDRVLDAASGTFGVRMELPNPQGLLPAGTRCLAAFTNIAAPAGLKARAASRDAAAGRQAPAPVGAAPVGTVPVRPAAPAAPAR
jgi:RND family efflux transporter MFP subunit